MKRVDNQEGLVSIMVATIIMIILSLMTVGFARLMQREQRQALDRSLSTGAFYAAESGVNKAVEKIQDGSVTTDKTTCATDSDFDGTVDDSIGAKYTCLLIDQSPPTLEYTQGSITTDSSKVIPLQSENANEPIKAITLSWEEDSSKVGTGEKFDTNCSNAGELPPITSWLYRTGMLRIDIIPADTLNRSTLITNTMSVYLYPCTGNTAVTSTVFNSSDANKGAVVNVKCDTTFSPRDCNLTIDTSASAQKRYYIRVRSVYKSSDMTISISNGTQQVGIKDAQVVVDSTGRVNDVVRRIQVRVPVHKTYDIPEFVIETTDSICKQIQVAPPSTVVGVGVQSATSCGY